MRIPVVAGNWKMYTTASEAVALVRALKPLVRDASSVEVAVCPPFVNLIPVAQEIKGSAIKLGGQNMHWEDEGAFTGEVSAKMLKEAGCRFVILGHSERRQYFGETDGKKSTRKSGKLWLRTSRPSRASAKRFMKGRRAPPKRSSAPSWRAASGILAPTT